MGFAQELADRAVAATGAVTIEAAVDWIVAHADDPPPAAPVASSAGAEAPPAQVFECDDCGMELLGTQMVQGHARSKGHAAFSERTERDESRPQPKPSVFAGLSTEEKAAKMAEIIASAKVQREADEQERNKERELIRRAGGQKAKQAAEDHKAAQARRDAQERKRQRDEDKRVRERLRAQLEADKVERRARIAAEKAKRNGDAAPAPAPVAVPRAAPVAGAAYVSAAVQSTVQVRLQGSGQSVTGKFLPDATLAVVAAHVAAAGHPEPRAFRAAGFPPKVFQGADLDTVTVKAAGLHPRGALNVVNPK